jgi:hypothetical protein
MSVVGGVEAEGRQAGAMYRTARVLLPVAVALGSQAVQAQAENVLPPVLITA